MGRDFNEHGRALTSSYICNLEKDFASYTDKRPQKRQNKNYSVYRSKNCTHATNFTRLIMDPYRSTHMSTSYYSSEPVLMLASARNYPSYSFYGLMARTSTSCTSLPPYAISYLRTYANSEPTPPSARTSSIYTYHSYRGML